MGHNTRDHDKTAFKSLRAMLDFKSLFLEIPIKI